MRLAIGVFGLQQRYITHGGLTPAAPADVRLCIAKIAISPADIRTPTQEREASAPRGFSPQVSAKRGKSSHGGRRRSSENDGG
jgi:hypothetical protein